MIYVSKIRADKAFKSILEGMVYEDRAESNLVPIYAYGEKPTGKTPSAFITIENNGTISGYLKSLEDARSKILVSVHTKNYNGMIDEFKEKFIFTQIEDILSKNEKKGEYFFELDFRNTVLNINNLINGYHTKGININWELIPIEDTPKTKLQTLKK